MSRRNMGETPAGSEQDLPDPPGPVATVLDPGQEFPPCLAELEMGALEVLHSRICRQLDREYLNPAGPHPQTLERHQELDAEFQTREATRS